MITLQAPTQLRAVLAFVIAGQMITRPRWREGQLERRGPVLKLGEAFVLSWASRLEREGPVLAPRARWTVENLCARSVSFGICTLAIGNISLAGRFNAIPWKARNYHENKGPLLMPRA